MSRNASGSQRQPLFWQAMANNTLSVEISFAWWIYPYLIGVRYFALLTGLEPDMAKVERCCYKAIRMRLVSGNAE